jgi:hypothetical protein
MNFPTRGIALAMRSRFPSTPDLTRPYSQLRHDIPGPAQTMTGMTYAKAITLTLILSLLFPIVSRAEMMSAQDLITACSADQRGRGVCDGYLMAVTDAILLRESRGRAQGRVCVPRDVTVNQVRDAVLNLSQRPRAARAPSGVMLVMIALRVNFRCQDEPMPPGPPGTQPGGPMTPPPGPTTQ